MQARVKSYRCAVRTALGGRVLLDLVVITILTLSGLAWAQSDGNMPAATETAQPTRAVATSHVGEITGNDVLIRSGPATTYYQCGRLYRGDRVQVVDTQEGWSAIVPPPGCFSWIAMQYVSINLTNPTMGVVTGDNVGVYAGSDFVLPMHSASRQVSLKRGQTVQLLSEEKDEYYKIAPPQGAYLWVSSQYIEPVRSPAEQEKVAAEPDETEDVDVDVATPDAKIATPPSESELLDAYHEVAKLVREEQVKPIEKQDYTAIKEQLVELAENKQAGQAARYAQFMLEQVERLELGVVVAKEIALQQEELEKVTGKIDKARAARLAEIENLGKYAIIGTLETSSLYSETAVAGQAGRYRILDESGRTVCYVAPIGPAVGQDLTDLIGRRVGLVGQIRPHEATGRAFVDFTEAVPLD